MPGFERGRKLDKVGQQESDTAELFFDDVQVPAANVIGEIDRGFIYMMQRLAHERIGSAVNNIAHARQILDETLDYAKERKAFGKPIGSFQDNKFTLAELQTKVEVTQAYVDHCVMEAVHGTLTAVDAAKAKWWSAQVQNDVLDACVQLYGGYGYMNEYRVARALARRPGLQDLGGLERDHEGAHRPRPGAVIMSARIGLEGPEAVIVAAARTPIGRAARDR